MNAYQIEDTPHSPGPQVEVPRPSREECSRQNSDFLLEGLIAAGKVKTYYLVALHARGEYRFNGCTDGHITTRPDSCNHRLCPWCRRRRIEKWGMSILNATCAVGEGYVFEALCELNPKSIRKSLSKAVLSRGAAAFYDIRPTSDDKWRLALVVVGLDAAGIDGVESAVRKATGGKMVPRRSFDMCDLGRTLDDFAVRIRDFRGRTGMLHDYLVSDFGHQTIGKRKPKAEVSPMVSTEGPVEMEPEEAAAQFEARLSVSEFAVDYPEPVVIIENSRDGDGQGEPRPSEMEVTPLHPGMVNVEGGSIIMSNAKGNTLSGGNKAPLEDKEGQSTAPEVEKTTRVSFAPTDSIRPGPPCSVCGKDTIFLGKYRPKNGRMEKVGTDGDGPSEIEGRKIFEPTGELRARLRDG